MSKRKDNIVYYVSLAITFVIVLWGIIAPKNFGDTANGIFKFLVDKFGWLYLMSMLFFVVFALGLAFSKYGNIKLGPDDSKPDFKYITWFGMLFGSGMGIGLVFWGVAEPLNHYMTAPGFKPGSVEAANYAMQTSFFHWGFHPWASYAIIGLALAYFQFRKNKPGLISTIFIPLLGEEKVNGAIGKMIDILAVFATVAGVATSLGLGTLQIGSGLNFVFGLPSNKAVQLIIVIVITILYIWTAVTGIEKGIKMLADINLVLAFGLLGLAFILGPSVKMISSLSNGIGMYMQNFIHESLHIEPFGDNSWVGAWRIFYWAWWIAWAPFVGIFIARISRGRTIKEFVIGVICVPALGSFIWFAVFGAMGINLGPEVAAKAIKSTETALFVVFNNYPLHTLLSIVAVLLLCTFFITSANSATFVLGMLTSQGDLNPSTQKKVIWGIIQSALAVALMFAGGLQTLQIASIAAAFPFAIIMILACVSLMKALKEEISVKSDNSEVPVLPRNSEVPVLPKNSNIETAGN
jgi:glycine betaine transporter